MDKGARHKLLNSFLVADLKQIRRAKGLCVTGVKDDLITRLLEQGNMLIERQATERDAESPGYGARAID